MTSFLWTIKGLLGLAAAVVSIGAGIYLLDTQSASADATVFDALMHGMGAYFIARGCWMLYRLAGDKAPDGVDV